MSANSIGHDNSVEAVSRFIKLLTAVPGVQSVWLGGSRSPKSPKNSLVHAQSDWDLQVITGTVNKSQVPSPSDLGIYVDLYWPDKPSKYATQVWPVDETGLFNEHNMQKAGKA
ncbi:hypothetical protein ACH42_06300 [Endozoicomonas sp. (ex Bugula neritina AB1)]|nr:hypothetical protein ACH42_06300 [Endozoicomonas sp. (ex Bugula neritina AB1)]